MVKWTNEQKLAIEKEGTNLIVSAGAGSGKTAVLSERVIRKLKSGVDIRHILILTFTNEAAGEMKERIRKKMQKEELTEQLAFLDASYITTFDAYALSLVKKYHYLFNLDAHLSIIDSSIISLERKRILDEIIMELYEKKDPRYLKLVGDFTDRDDDTIKSAILSMSATLDLRYDKTTYLKHYVDTYYRDDYIDGLFLEYFHYLKNLCLMIEEDYYALESFLSEKVNEKCYQALSPIFKPRNYQDLYQKRLELPRFQNLDEEAKEIKEDLKNLVHELNDLTVYSEEELKEQIASTKDYVLAIIDIILKLDERIFDYKQKKNAFEFVDISKMAISLVKNHEDIREEIKNSYQEIMIDEYQDTNDLQEMFIREIENHNVYMVGDIKQSIYRFRNANPNIFREKYENYKNHVDGEKIDLLENFRSRKGVLQAINDIFNFIMIPELGGVDYQDHHAMIFGNMAYEESGKNEENHDLEILKYSSCEGFTSTEIEAFLIAQDINKKVLEHIQVYDFDLGCNRDIQYKDFCIILDRGKAMGRYKKIFEYFHIPMQIYQDSNLVEQEDLLIIRNIIRLVLAIYHQEYDSNMRYYFMSVARSYIGNMSDEEIFELLTHNTFYNTELYKKAYELSLKIDEFTPNKLLKEIIRTFDFYEKMISVGNVGDAMIRLDYLCDLAQSMEALGFTVVDFKDYLGSMITSKMEIRYRESAGGNDSVKIMNIHKSKGLEFPVCYFAGFKEKFNLRDLQSRFMVDSTYGILTPFYQEGIGTLFTKELIKNKYLEEEIAEKIRLFYVALTRAKEKIIIVLPEFKKENYVKNRVGYLTEMKYRSFYDFMTSISLNLKDYAKVVDSTRLGLTKDYEYPPKKTVHTYDSKDVMVFQDLGIEAKRREDAHASKEISSILVPEEAKKLEFGTKIHEMLEHTDFKNYKQNNPYVLHLLDTFDFSSASIYQELEFFFTYQDLEYHGIIDLMLEYDDEIKIIDYKLKNILDDAYIRQLNVYYEYIRIVSDKKISLYLYSIIDHQVEKVKAVGISS